MADKILNVRIQTRTDTEANWKSKNPVLLKGEVGITSDNKRYKVGDGTTAWSSLSYATLSWSDITDKPSTYTPSAHNHAISDVTNLQTTLNGKAPSTGSTTIKTLASTITLGTGDAATIEQANGTYRQRIKIIDNSTANDEVFGFYQSADSGSTYTDLFSIRDDGVVVAKTFSGGLSGNATTMSYPQGFASRTTAATWGNQDGTVLTDWHTSNGGDIAFRENGGQLNVVTDGFFYQNEGKFKCLDTNNYSSYALPLSGGTMGGTAFISWPDTGNWSNKNEGVTFPVARGGLKWSGQSDGVQLYAEETANDNLELVLKFTDDNSNGLSIRNASGTTTARITATGTFTGNASTATKATQDSAGQQINTTYIKGLSVSGRTITYTKGNGTTATITTQDTTYSAATTSSNGLMSAADKKKLDGIAEGANKITVDSALSSTSTNPVQNKVVNTALGTKASMVTLSASANLNEVTTPGFYNCGGGNSITNKPSGLDAIGLIVVHNAAGNYYTQILTNSTNANTYRRTCANGTWSAWTQDKYTDTNTTYSAGTGLSLSGTTFSNSGVRSITTGTANGTISVNTNGTTANVAVKGLGSAAYTASTAYATAGHNHDSVYLKLSGGTMTGAISRAGGGSWISARNNATVKGTNTGSDSFNVVASQKTSKGSWNIGNLGSNEYLAFSYDTDENFTAGTNKSTVTYLPTTGGTIALTSQVVSKSGDTMTGALKFANNTWNTVGDDASMGDHNIAGAFCIVGANGGTKLALCNKDNQSDYAYIGYEGGNLLVNKTIAGSITGNAGSADKIGSATVGSATKPVYINAGVPTAGTYTLADACSKKVKNLSAVSHTGWTSNTVDDAIVPTMSFMAYWNGAYSSSGSSNLQYCDRGRLGTIVTKSTGDFLASSGGTLSGDVLFSNSGTTTRQVRFTVGDNDYARLAAGATATNSGWVELASADDGNEPVYVRQYTGVFSTIKRTATLLDSSGNTTFPGVVTAPTFKGALSGNADTTSALRRYTSGDTSSDKSGYWYKIASCSLTTQYSNQNIHFIIEDNNHGGESVDFFEGIARLKQQAAMGSAPSYSIRCKGRYGLTTSNVQMVITTNTTATTTAEVWAQIPKTYTVHNVSIISNTGWTVNTNMALQQTLPTGTAKAAEDKAIVGTANIAYADESNNNIKTSYGASLTVSGRTVKLLSKSGATLSTITTQDTNTWRGIQDNLTSTSTSDSLSANQGRVLATKISDHQSNVSNPHSVTKAQVGLGNVANILQIGAVSALGFYGMARPDGNTTDWIRTTSNGIIPYQSGSANSGHSSLGTSTWYFSKAYIDNIFDSTGTNIKTKYVNKLTVNNDLITYTMGDGTANQLTIGSIDKIIDVVLPTSGWTQNTSTGRWSLTVSNSEIKSTYNALCVARADTSWSASTLKTYNKAFSIVCSGTATTADGSVSFSTIKKPATDITIALYCTTACDSLAADNSLAVSKQYVDNQLAKYTQPGNLAYVNYTVVKTI